MNAATATAAAAGSWKLGDLTVNRVGFGAMRLTGTAPAGALRLAPDEMGRLTSLHRS